jgi:hypothetical protein
MIKEATRIYACIPQNSAYRIWSLSIHSNACKSTMLMRDRFDTFSMKVDWSELELLSVFKCLLLVFSEFKIEGECRCVLFSLWKALIVFECLLLD